MYESPISLVIDQLATELATAFDKEVLTAFRRYHIDIDKDELIKALAYDRGQYEKGYTDGLMAERWVSVEDRLPEKSGVYLTWCEAYSGDGFYRLSHYEADERGWYSWIHHDWSDSTVKSWMPLPEPPEEVQNG